MTVVGIVMGTAMMIGLVLLPALELARLDKCPGFDVVSFVINFFVCTSARAGYE